MVVARKMGGGSDIKEEKKWLNRYTKSVTKIVPKIEKDLKLNQPIRLKYSGT